MAKYRKNVTWLNEHQQHYYTNMKMNHVSVGIGPAGTGKTFLAVCKALELFESNIVDRIILTRPAIETGESIGYLPGDILEKMDPYLRPLYDVIKDRLGPKAVVQLQASGELEISCLAYMRGRTFNKSAIILDEAQNTTIQQMKMFMTRFGEEVFVAITGDDSQSDLREENGLAYISHRLRPCGGVTFTDFENKDTVRSNLVRNILEHI